MIASDAELTATLERIRHFQAQVARLRMVEHDPETCRLSASGFLAEIDRLESDVSQYRSSGAAAPAALSEDALVEIAEEQFRQLDTDEARR
jgi:MinD-like ATPase involved in chromosome partitioning or flagellar assembly